MTKTPRLTLLLATTILLTTTAVYAQTKPNVVLIFMDNFGYGELGSYGGGIIRGAPTPRIDQLAAEGIRLTNFNVEAQCTPSRAALLTGRYAVRTGNATVPAQMDSTEYGLLRWEYTMAEMFSDAGYETAMFGKWHLGNTPGRYPTDQGFDVWYGIADSTNIIFFHDNDRIPREDREVLEKSAQVLFSEKGKDPISMGDFDLERRPLIDDEITTYAENYIEGQARAKDAKPFFLFLPYTQTHQPRLPHPKYAGSSGNGVWGDLLTQIDDYTGRVMDALEKGGLADNTIMIFTSDNGGDFYEDGSFPGPWRGTYFTGLEGSLRVPCIIRWPGHITAGRVSNEIVHAMDLLPTFAHVAGGKLVTEDRVIDGVNQHAFLTSKLPRVKSARESVIVYVADQIYGVKWRDWKGVYEELDAGYGAPVKDFLTPVLYDLYNDPREEKPVSKAVEENTWVGWKIGQVLKEHKDSLEKYPPIPPGTPDLEPRTSPSH